jgi:hypothetical protein
LRFWVEFYLSYEILSDSITVKEEIDQQHPNKDIANKDLTKLQKDINSRQQYRGDTGETDGTFDKEKRSQSSPRPGTAYDLVQT